MRLFHRHRWHISGVSVDRVNQQFTDVLKRCDCGALTTQHLSGIWRLDELRGMAFTQSGDGTQADALLARLERLMDAMADRALPEDLRPEFDAAFAALRKAMGKEDSMPTSVARYIDDALGHAQDGGDV